MCVASLVRHLEADRRGREMNKRVSLAAARRRRVMRVRSHLGVGSKPRLSVHATGRHIYTQLIDDVLGVTVVSANSCESTFSTAISSGGNVQAATVVGRLLAERALAAGISRVLFDRGGKRYHGRVAAVADSARAVGLVF